MSNSTSNPIQVSSSTIISEFVPEEIWAKIMIFSDPSTFCNSLSLVSKDFYQLYCATFHSFFSFNHYLTEEFLIRPITTSFLEAIRSIKRLSLLCESDEDKKSEENPKFRLYPPITISKWSNEMPVQEDSRVLAFMNDDRKNLDCVEVHSLVILSKKRPKKHDYLKAMGLFSLEKLPHVKQLVLCNVEFDTRSVKSMDSLKLHFFCLRNCKFMNGGWQRPSLNQEISFSTNVLCIELNETCDYPDFIFCSSLKHLTVRQSNFDVKNPGELYYSMDFSNSLLLKIM